MNIALIFAGGVGSRMNARAYPKQFLEIHGKPIIIYTLEHFEAHPQIDAVCVVCVEDWLAYVRMLIHKFNIKKVRWIVPGGSSALESQYHGLTAISDGRDLHTMKADIVLVHDGVRPLIDQATITKCLKVVRDWGSAVTVAPAIETIIHRAEDGSIASMSDRSECMLARAPQCFYLSDILEVHKKAIADGRYDYVDSASMMLAYGYKIHTVLGSSENIKVTTPSDFYICRALLDAREDSQIFGL